MTDTGQDPRTRRLRLPRPGHLISGLIGASMVREIVDFVVYELTAFRVVSAVLFLGFAVWGYLRGRSQPCFYRWAAGGAALQLVAELYAPFSAVIGVAAGVWLLVLIIRHPRA